jgi:UPF0271 protein
VRVPEPLRTLELNADVGELPGEEGRARDREILAVVNAASIACGAHAGDDETIAATLRACAELDVASGAHPSYPDREGFGRRRGDLAPAGIRSTVAEQVARVVAIGRKLGVPVTRVKAHGALYNEAAFDRGIADAFLAGVADALPGAALLGLAASPFLAWAREAGFDALAEGFADRGYRPDGRLVPRSEPGALVHEPDAVAERAVRLALEGRVLAADGSDLTLAVDSLCLHGDSAGAAERARTLASALRAAGVGLQAAAAVR